MTLDQCRPGTPVWIRWANGWMAGAVVSITGQLVNLRSVGSLCRLSQRYPSSLRPRNPIHGGKDKPTLQDAKAIRQEEENRCIR